MARKMKIEIEVSGLEDWHKDSSDADTILALTFLMKEISASLANNLGVDASCVTVRSINLDKIQAEIQPQ